MTRLVPCGRCANTGVWPRPGSVCPCCGGVGSRDTDAETAARQDVGLAKRVSAAAHDWVGPNRSDHRARRLAGVAMTTFFDTENASHLLDALDQVDLVVVAEIVEAIRAAVDPAPARCTYSDDDVVACVAPAASQVRAWPYGEWRECCETHHEAVTAAAIAEGLAAPRFPGLEATP